MPFVGLNSARLALNWPRRQTSDSFLSLPLWGGRKGTTERGAPSSLFVAAPESAVPLLWLRLGLASSWTPLRDLVPHQSSWSRVRSRSRVRVRSRALAFGRCVRIQKSRANGEVVTATFSSGRLAPMRHRLHQQLLAEPDSGTEVPSRGGQSASVRCVRRAARRPESRPFARSRPGRFLGPAFPSMRFLDPRF